METSLGFLFTGLLCLWCHDILVQGELCRYTNTQGNMKTFFSTSKGVTAFPCSYRLADFRCGKAKTVVLASNGVDDTGNLFMRDVTVDISITTYGKTIRQVNKLSAAYFHKFVSRGNLDRKLWTYTVDGQTPEKDDRIRGYYDKATKAAYVAYGDLRVDWMVASDVLAIRCPDDALKSAVKFPKNICGSPDNTDADVVKLDSALPHNKSVDMTLARLDFVQLAKQDIEQTKPLCVEASKLASGRCDNKGNKLYQCHQLYSPFVNGLYGKCMRKNDIDAFRVYVTCLRVLCSKKKRVPLSKLECKLLEELSEKCGDRKASPVLASELLDRAVCGLPQKYRVTTTKKPKATTKAPVVWNGGW